MLSAPAGPADLPRKAADKLVSRPRMRRTAVCPSIHGGTRKSAVTAF